RATRSAAATICAGARSGRCASPTSRWTRWWARSNAALPPNRVVSDNRNAEGPVRGQARYAEALARRRVPVGFAFAALVLWLSRPTFSTLGIGTAIAIVGETIRVWAAGHLNKSREVTTSGPYRWSAHPLYVGSTVIGIGLGVASSSLAAVALI